MLSSLPPLPLPLLPLETWHGWKRENGREKKGKESERAPKSDRWSFSVEDYLPSRLFARDFRNSVRF